MAGPIRRPALPRIARFQETSYAVDLVDPQYVHDQRQERKRFCQAKGLKHSACSLSFRREETIQSLLRADSIVSKAGDLPAMTREQAEQLVDGSSGKRRV